MRSLSIAAASLFAASCMSPRSTTSGAPPSAQAVTIHRSIFCSSQPCGSSVVTFLPDGSITGALDIHDNGRGPHSDVVLQLAADGTIAAYESHGHTVMGAHVDETFTSANGRAMWASNEEHGEQALQGPAFFVPVSTSDTNPFLLAALVRNGGTLALLPTGTAHLERAGEATVHLSAGDKHLVLQAVTGLDFLPTYIWTEDDGTYFGEVTPWTWIGPEGAEGAAPQLLTAQLAINRTRDAAVLQRLAHRSPEGGFALVHARVLEVEKGEWLLDQTVLISGEKISAVGPSSKVQIPAGAETIDLAGKALLPGLWDMHAHFGDADGVLDVASGVTTARDVGNTANTLDDYKRRFDAGNAVGPHLFRAGFIEGRGPDASHSEITATNEDEARAAVEFFAKRGYEMIKIYNSVDPKLVPFLTREAHARGMGVTGHIPAHMLAHEAVEAGYDGIEHANQVLLNFFADHETDTRTLRRFTLVGEKAADFDYQSRPAQDFFAELRAHHTLIDPTLSAFEPLYIAELGQVLPGFAAAVSRLPPQVQRGYLSGGLEIAGPGQRELYARSWKKMERLVKELQDSGVPVVAGTDGLAGLQLEHELELLVEGGLTPAEALRDATIASARAMKVEASTGSIAAGKIADLVIIDGDPLASISDARKTVATFRAGVEFNSAALFQTVGVAAWK